MTGDVIGELAYKYGMMYGEAFCMLIVLGGRGCLYFNDDELGL